MQFVCLSEKIFSNVCKLSPVLTNEGVIVIHRSSAFNFNSLCSHVPVLPQKSHFKLNHPVSYSMWFYGIKNYHGKNLPFHVDSSRHRTDPKCGLWPSVAARTPVLHLQPGDAVLPHHGRRAPCLLPAPGERREDLPRHHRPPLPLCLPPHGLREHAGHVRDSAAHWCVQSRVSF